MSHQKKILWKEKQKNRPPGTEPRTLQLFLGVYFASPERCSAAYPSETPKSSVSMPRHLKGSPPRTHRRSRNLPRTCRGTSKALRRFHIVEAGIFRELFAAPPCTHRGGRNSPRSFHRVSKVLRRVCIVEAGILRDLSAAPQRCSAVYPPWKPKSGASFSRSLKGAPPRTHRGGRNPPRTFRGASKVLCRVPTVEAAIGRENFAVPPRCSAVYPSWKPQSGANFSRRLKGAPPCTNRASRN